MEKNIRSMLQEAVAIVEKDIVSSDLFFHQDWDILVIAVARDSAGHGMDAFYIANMGLEGAQQIALDFGHASVEMLTNRKVAKDVQH